MLRSVLLGLAIAVAMGSVWAGDWPQWLGPHRNGSSDEVIQPWSAPLKQAWKASVGEGHSSPIVAAGRVFLHTKAKDEEREQVEAFDAKTGQPLWKESYE